MTTAPQKRLAWFSPIPPQPGGVSEYSRQFLAALRKSVDVCLVNDEVASAQLPADLSWLKVLKSREFAALPKNDVLPVYNMMNNVEQSGGTFEALRNVPGLAILHDLNIHGFLLDKYGRDKKQHVGNTQSHPYAELLHEAHGEPGLREAIAVLQRQELPDIPGFPCHGLITATSRAVVCHSHWAVRQLKSNCHGAQIFHLPQGMDPIASPAIAEDPRLVVCAGYLEPSRRLEEVVRAVSALARRGINATARFVGSVSKDYRSYVENVARESKVSRQVEFSGFVDDNGFMRAMAEAAVVIHLRRPTMGETSATSLRALALGKPLLVSNIASYSELPDDCAWKVDTGPTELPLLTDYLESLLSRPDLRMAMGENSLRYMNAQHSWNRAAGEFLQILDQIN